MEDTSKLEYQAGQEEEVGDAKHKPKPEAQKQKEQQQQDADGDNSKGEEGGEEGGVNEDVEDKYEDSNFAPPTAPEQVGRKWRQVVSHASLALVCVWHTSLCVACCIG